MRSPTDNFLAGLAGLMMASTYCAIVLFLFYLAGSVLLAMVRSGVRFFKKRR